MANRLQAATQHLRDRLRVTGGITATIYDGDTAVASGITLVQLSLHRLVRTESEFQIEADDAAFLVGVDDMADEPTVGMRIVVGLITYRVTEKPELQTAWRWHDMSRTQRVVFTKEWAEAEE